jgi:chromosome segregation ATPase
MSDNISATGTSAEPTAQATDQATVIQNAVAQVKDARAKEAKLRGMPELAKIFKEGKPAAATSEQVAEAVAASKADTKATAGGKVAGETKPAAEAKELVAEANPEDAAATADQDSVATQRREARVKELAELARAGREKWQAKQAERQQRGEVDRMKAEVEAERAKIAADKAKLDAAVKDPLKFLEAMGLPPEELAKQVIRRGDPTAQTEALRAELEEFKRQQREAAEADAKARREHQDNERRAAAHMAARNAETQFVRMASDVNKYPALNALYSPEEILMKAHRVAAQARAADPNIFYDDSEIADFLEQEALPRLQKARGGSPVQTPKSPETPAAPVGQPDPGPKSRTLTSELQSELGVDSEAFKKLPRSKQNQIIGEQLKRLTQRKV